MLPIVTYDWGLGIYFSLDVSIGIFLIHRRCRAEDVRCVMARSTMAVPALSVVAVADRPSPIMTTRGIREAGTIRMSETMTTMT